MTKEQWRELVAYIYRDSIEGVIARHRRDLSRHNLISDEITRLNAQARELASAVLDLRAATQEVGFDDRDQGDDPNAPALAEHHAIPVIQGGLKAVEQHLIDSGLAEAVDEHLTMIVSNLDPEDLPPQDLRLLERSGSADARSELQLSIERIKQEAFLAGRVAERERSAARAVSEARALLQDPPTQPRRRWFKGLGAIAKGAMFGAFDTSLLLGGAAAAPPILIGAVGSIVVGIGDITSGVGDLRGE